MTNSKNSEIHLLASIEKEAIQQVIETQLPVVLLENFSPGGDTSLNISVKRYGKIDLDVQQNTFNYQVPLQLFAKKKTFLGTADVAFEMYIGLATKFLFKDDWELITRTQLTGYQWITKPKLDLGIVNFPLENIILRALEKNKTTIGQQIDEQIKRVADVRPMLNQVLSNLPNPIPTPAGGNIYWKCETVTTYMSPLREEGELILGNIKLAGATEFAYGSPLEKVTTVIKAPDLVKEIPTESHLQTQITVDFKAVEKVAIILLQKQSFEFKGQKVNVTSVQVSQVGQRLKVAAELDGSFKGSMTLIGKPVFDNAKKEIQLQEVDLDLRGNNFLSKTLVVLLRNIIEEKISEFLVFPIQKSLDFANQKISYFSFPNGAFTRGKINDVQIPQVDVQAEALVLNVLVKVDLEIGLEAKKIA